MNTKLLTMLATLMLLLLATAAVRAQSAYSNAVISLNAAGYWPMHESTAPAAGDIETNYGTLGPLGNGYYPDWVQNYGSFVRQAAGPFTEAGNSDTAVTFDTSGSGTWFTNTVYVAHGSPLSTLNPPFSVEYWYHPTATTAKDMWGQYGKEGLNAGNVNGGNGPYSGMAGLYNGGFTVENYNGVNTTGTGSPASKGLADNNWYYVVITCDANTNVTLWTNGVEVSTVAEVSKFSPDYWTPLTIGGAADGAGGCPGSLSEFAVYPNVISDEASKYSDGTTVGASQYYHDVTNDNPEIYLRMNAPNYSAPASGTWPVLQNLGTTNGVAINNGLYTPGTVPGVLGGPTNFSGALYLGVSNNSAFLSGVSSFGDAGYAAAYNPTGSNANFSVTAIFRGYPCDGRVQSIASHGTNSWELDVTTNGCLAFNAGNGMQAAGVTAGYGAASGDMKTVGVYNNGQWHQVVAVNQTNVISIYVDGMLDTNGMPTGIAVTNLIFGNTEDVMIGSDPNYTNIPAGPGRQFAGQICEVAFFTNALTFGQIQTLYSNCEVAPYIITQPISASVNAGTAFTNTVVVHGSATLSYQWYTNGVAFGGQIGASLILNPVVAGDASTNYYMVVKNNYGSVTSAVVS